MPTPPPPHHYAGKGYEFDNRHKSAYAVNGKWEFGGGGGHLPLIFKTVKQNGFYCDLKKEGVLLHPVHAQFHQHPLIGLAEIIKKNLKPH